MQQIMNVWTTLDLQRRLIVVLGTLAMVAAVFGIARMATQPSMALLYSGLENGAAGEVVRTLEQRGVQFEIRGGAIFVDATQRDSLRMTLASEGLPANSAKGYELLDSLTGFGTTSQMFDAAYWRAKEGELARTMLAVPGVTSARVHIANSDGNPFRRNVQPSASVVLTTSNGTPSAAQARALRYLVASAVSGMDPDNVTVIDGNGVVVSGADDQAPANSAEDKSAALRDKVQRLVEARVGVGNAVVEITVESVMESESIRETRFDPTGRVAISTETEEISDRSQNSGGGAVTVASNLPDGAGGGGDNSNSQNNQTRERVNYEVSETQRQIERAPGAVKRLSVAVLVNALASQGADGTVILTPRGDDELMALRDLVASAVGFDQARGDVITIKSMQFEAVSDLGTLAVPGWLDRLAFDAMSIIQLAVLAIVALLLGLFVVRPVLMRSAPPPLRSALPPPPDPVATPNNQPVLTGEIADEDGRFQTLPATRSSNDGPPHENPVERLRAMIGERQTETVEILRSWLEDKEESVR